MTSTDPTTTEAPAVATPTAKPTIGGILSRRVQVPVWALIATGLLALILITTGGGKSTVNLPAAASDDVPAAAVNQPAPTTPAARNWPDLTTDDLTLALTVTSKQCFGSAGCSIEFDPALTVANASKFETGSKWRVIYEVQGAEDPFTGSLTVTFTATKVSWTWDDWTHVDTNRSGDELTATITSVREL